MTTITPEIVEQHNLTPGEYDRIVAILGREPNLTELGVFSVMWSEHCSYKSSRVHLKRLPTSGPRVIVPPGENAGVIDVGDDWCVAFKVESHNHPSAVEPYQGAATGVGGILRDVFTMGARPIAMLDSLRFGSLDHPRVRYLFAGVVKGIGDYGNSVGVPTIGGEVVFDPAYETNPLVNAMCVGVLPTERVLSAKAQGVGSLLVLYGAYTGRDGIGGASVLASPKEGWGISNLEAAACGTSVIAANSPGIRESVVNGETGFLVPQNDYHAMSASMRGLVKSRDLVEVLGVAARRFAVPAP